MSDKNESENNHQIKTADFWIEAMEREGEVLYRW